MYYCVAAIFSVPAIMTVRESEETLTVCTILTTHPPQATIANEVTLTLSTVDGTG